MFAAEQAALKLILSETPKTGFSHGFSNVGLIEKKNKTEKHVVENHVVENRILKETKSATMNIFRKFLFSF